MAVGVAEQLVTRSDVRGRPVDRRSTVVTLALDFLPVKAVLRAVPRRIGPCRGDRKFIPTALTDFCHSSDALAVNAGMVNFPSPARREFPVTTVPGARECRFSHPVFRRRRRGVLPGVQDGSLRAGRHPRLAPLRCGDERGMWPGTFGLSRVRRRFALVLSLSVGLGFLPYPPVQYGALQYLLTPRSPSRLGFVLMLEQILTTKWWGDILTKWARRRRPPSLTNPAPTHRGHTSHR